MFCIGYLGTDQCVSGEHGKNIFKVHLAHQVCIVRYNQPSHHLLITMDHGALWAHCFLLTCKSVLL